MNTFKINGIDFGIGEVVCEIDNNVIRNLSITGDINIGKSICLDDENGEFYLMPFDPMIFFKSVPFEKNIPLEITDDLLDEYDISFVWHEHNDIYGTLTVNDNQILIDGEIRPHMSDEKLYTVEIVLAR